MCRQRMLAVVLVGLGVQAVRAAEGVKVSGSKIRFAPRIEARVGDQPVKLVLTGTAARTKWGLNVYAIGSYLQEGTPVRDAGGLVAVDTLKLLHLVFERDVDGETMARSFKESLALNHPAPEFAPELAQLMQFLRPRAAHRGDQFWLTSLPGVGLRCQKGKDTILIRNVGFARAIWEIYLGPTNLSAKIKSGLTSRL